MSKNKETKEQVIERLNNIPYDVLFTKESVIEIIESIKSSEQQNKVDYDKLKKEVTERVIDALDSINSNDLVMNPTFTLRGNEIELESCDIDNHEVINAVTPALYEYFEQMDFPMEEETNN